MSLTSVAGVTIATDGVVGGGVRNTRCEQLVSLHLQ